MRRTSLSDLWASDHWKWFPIEESPSFESDQKKLVRVKTQEATNMFPVYQRPDSFVLSGH